MSFTTDNNRRNSLFLQKIEIDMEQLNVFDCSNVLIASFFTDDRGCAHENREHTLIYLCSGELEIEERGKKTILHPGECAFMRRDNRMWLQKHADEEHPYRSVVLKFTKPFLREFYQTLDRKEIPMESKREKVIVHGKRRYAAPYARHGPGGFRSVRYWLRRDGHDLQP